MSVWAKWRKETKYQNNMVLLSYKLDSDIYSEISNTWKIFEDQIMENFEQPKSHTTFI